MCDVPREDMTGAELAAARQSMGLTVAELADLLGIADHKRIRQWEKGHTNHGDPAPIPPGIATEIHDLLHRHHATTTALATQAHAGDGIIYIPRPHTPPHHKIPASWLLAAAANARATHPDLRIQWTTPTPETPTRKNAKPR